MNRILPFGLAIIAATFVAQPAYAEKGGGRGGGGGKSGGGVHVSAPAVRANVMRAPAPTHFSMAKAPSVYHSAPIVKTTPTFTPSVGKVRSFSQPKNNAPSIAFGGHVKNDGVVNSQNVRTFSGTRSDVRGMRPPMTVSRDWDRGRIHEWNHRRFRWYGGDWVILDDPFFYGGYYPDTYDNGYYEEPTPTMSYDSSESLAASVQDRLSRAGYSPGPVDGVIGPQTRDAIADFQNDHNLSVTGQIDRQLLRALGL